MAWQYIQTILKRFPNTYFSKQMALATKDGFTEHWYTDAQPCPVAGADPPSNADARTAIETGPARRRSHGSAMHRPANARTRLRTNRDPEPGTARQKRTSSGGNESTRNANARDPGANDIRNAKRIAFTKGRRRNEESTTGTKG